MVVLIPNSAFDSATATTIVSANILRNTNWGSSFFMNRDTIIMRPGAATAADFMRWAGVLTTSTGTLAHTGANYADTTVGTETVELWYDNVRPDLELMDAANRALEFVNLTTLEPLSHLGDNDGGMSASVTTAYSATNTTLTKITTAGKMDWGIRALRAINSAGSGYAQSATMTITQGRPWTAFALPACAISSATFTAYDVTNSAALPGSVTSAEFEPQLVQIPWQNAPATCKQIARQLGGVSATADVAWNAAWFYKQDSLRVNLPSFVSEDFKAAFIFQARPQFVSTTAYVYPAASLRFIPLTEGKDYELLINQGDTNPYAVQFNHAGYFDWPLFVQVRRPYRRATLRRHPCTSSCLSSKCRY